ncbi:MAG: hypothetical protein ACRCYL_13980 [Kluyvera sp.]
MAFFRQCSTQVDYGEQELGTEQLLLGGAEYQEYLFDEARSYPAIGDDRLNDIESFL